MWRLNRSLWALASLCISVVRLFNMFLVSLVLPPFCKHQIVTPPFLNECCKGVVLLTDYPPPMLIQIKYHIAVWLWRRHVVEKNGGIWYTATVSRDSGVISCLCCTAWSMVINRKPKYCGGGWGQNNMQHWSTVEEKAGLLRVLRERFEYAPYEQAGIQEVNLDQQLLWIATLNSVVLPLTASRGLCCR